MADETQAPAQQAPADDAPPSQEGWGFFDPRQPRAEDAIGAAAAINGWEFFETDAARLEAFKRKTQAKEQRLAAIAVALWTVPEFRELVEHLLDVTIRRAPVPDPLGVPVDQAYAFNQKREGQNSIVWMLMKMIAEGRRMQAPAPRETA